MEIRPNLDAQSETALYRQLGSYLQDLIRAGELAPGDRLPPTRELAGQLGLNRTTVSSAYDSSSRRSDQGRGGSRQLRLRRPHAHRCRSIWSRAPTASVSAPAAAHPPAGAINFSSSRPSEQLFPLDEFRACCQEVLDEPEHAVLCCSSVRRGAMSRFGAICWRARPDLHRARFRRHSHHQRLPAGTRSAAAGTGSARATRLRIEEPVYPGLKNLFLEAGAELIGVPVGADGVDLLCPAAGARCRRESRGSDAIVPESDRRVDPGGESRAAICGMARAAGAVVIENDIYSELAYHRRRTAPHS